MKLPIQYAFSYPKRLKSRIGGFRFYKISGNDLLSRLIRKYFKEFWARKAGSLGGSMPIVFNAANEIAVDYFLKKKK